MRNLSPNMLALLKQDGIGALAEFWMVTRTDNVQLSFTNWSQDVGVYKTAPGWSRSALQMRSDLAAPNQELTGIDVSHYITEIDVRAGRYDGARVEHFYGVPTDPDFLTYGRVYLPAHYIGEIRLEDGIYILEIRGYAYALQQNLMEIYGPICRADFADKHGENRCKLDPANFTATGNVRVAGSYLNGGHNYFTVNPESGTILLNWQFGTVTWTTGANVGLTMEISTVDLTTEPGFPHIVLYLSMPYAMQPGDKFTAIAGCAKTIEACHLYDNVKNMRAEPWIPGMSLLLDYGTGTG